MTKNHDPSDRIRPYEKNPAYFQYKGKPVLLLGGSVEDNLFQIPDLKEHLNLLKSLGGNYVRCTMSSRDEGDVWAFPKDPETGLYDLDSWDEEYWDRFSRFLKLTHQMEIIPQVELWATWDFYKHVGDPWLHNAWNPRNNSTYTEEESGLPEEWDYAAPTRINPFFETIPALGDNTTILERQKKFIDRIMALSLRYDHVLYCMDNETNTDPEWGFFWNRYIKDKARQAGVEIETTEMWDNWDPSDGKVPGARQQLEKNLHPFLSRSQPMVTIAHPEEYSFVDISNHNAQLGEPHWWTGQYIRDRIIETGIIRPLTCDKMYGGTIITEFTGTGRDGLERFWRNIFGGFAACRFHRPPTGHGLSETSQPHIRSMRMLMEKMDTFSCQPLLGKLSDRKENSAYCFGREGSEYAVVFLDGGSVTLECSGVKKIKWLDIEKSEWLQESAVEPGKVKLEAPGRGFWACILE